MFNLLLMTQIDWGNRPTVGVDEPPSRSLADVTAEVTDKRAQLAALSEQRQRLSEMIDGMRWEVSATLEGEVC